MKYHCEKGINLQYEYFVNYCTRRDMHVICTALTYTNRHKRDRLKNAHNTLAFNLNQDFNQLDLKKKIANLVNLYL